MKTSQIVHDFQRTIWTRLLLFSVFVRLKELGLHSLTLKKITWYNILIHSHLINSLTWRNVCIVCTAVVKWMSLCIWLLYEMQAHPLERAVCHSKQQSALRDPSHLQSKTNYSSTWTAYIFFQNIFFAISCQAFLVKKNVPHLTTNNSKFQFNTSAACAESQVMRICGFGSCKLREINGKNDKRGGQEMGLKYRENPVKTGVLAAMLPTLRTPDVKNSNSVTTQGNIDLWGQRTRPTFSVQQ